MKWKLQWEDCSDRVFERKKMIPVNSKSFNKSVTLSLHASEEDGYGDLKC